MVMDPVPTVGRRKFLYAAASAGVLASVPRVRAAQRRGGPRFEPAGRLRARIDMTARRLLEGTAPAYTDDFVLADLVVDRRRRFAEYSGDISGRYIGALSLLPSGDSRSR